MNDVPSSTFYDDLRGTILGETGEEARVEVNQRALIDKVLARYASAFSVYRELFQNSNDAGATRAEVHFTTATEENDDDNNNNNGGRVKQVMYRNNGAVFSGADWARLKKIAEGNPDPDRIGQFGVGAYTIFSISEEPVVVSGTQALAFVWKGDALWTRTASTATMAMETMAQEVTKNRDSDESPWTSFLLPPREPCDLPDWKEFGEFCVASLMFTKSLLQIKVYVNDRLHLSIVKTQIRDPEVLALAEDAAMTSSQNMLSLRNVATSVWQFDVALLDQTASCTSHFVESLVDLHLSDDQSSHIQRVTLKKPPRKVAIQLCIRGATCNEMTDHNKNAVKILDPLLQSTEGRIYIGFRTSQTTGMGGTHVAAPFWPTVEREAIDLQEPTLSLYNLQLLEMAGMMSRHMLEHFMFRVIRSQWDKAKKEKESSLFLVDDSDAQPESDVHEPRKTNSDTQPTPSMTELDVSDPSEMTEADSTAFGLREFRAEAEQPLSRTSPQPLKIEARAQENKTKSARSLRGLSRFFRRGRKRTYAWNKMGTEHASSLSPSEPLSQHAIEENFSQPVAKDPDAAFQAADWDALSYKEDTPASTTLDNRPVLSIVENRVVAFLQSYCPEPSTPSSSVGEELFRGFHRAMPETSSLPVLTQSGIARASQAKLPYLGIEAFANEFAVRKEVLAETEGYHISVAKCRNVSLPDLVEQLTKNTLDETSLVLFLKWWATIDLSDFEKKDVCRTKFATTFFPESGTKREMRHLLEIHYYIPELSLLIDKGLPMPPSVIPREIQDAVGQRLISSGNFASWFTPLPKEVWLEWISAQPCMTSGPDEDKQTRLHVLQTLCRLYWQCSGSTTFGSDLRSVFGALCNKHLGGKKFLPVETDSGITNLLEYPKNAYVPSANLDGFHGIESCPKIPAFIVEEYNISEDFLVALGARETVPIDLVLSNLEHLDYGNNVQALIGYFLGLDLTVGDYSTLSTAHYLPAEDDSSRLFAPTELCLPNPALSALPFAKILKWPSDLDISESSSNGQFLLRIGIKTFPPLLAILEYLSNTAGLALESDNEADDALWNDGLDILSGLVAHGGLYHEEYGTMTSTERKRFRFFPCLSKKPFEPEKSQKLSCSSCYVDEKAMVMGFCVLDPALGKKAHRFADAFQCQAEPSPSSQIEQLMKLVSIAKEKLSSETGAEYLALAERVECAFQDVFLYLAKGDWDGYASASTLKNVPFIPILVDSELRWLRSDQVYFRQKSMAKDAITEHLFHAVDFNLFLSSVGVKQDPSPADLFELILESPEHVLELLGNEDNKYRSLLRRIAANPPVCSYALPRVQNSPFLLAYKTAEEKTKDGNEETFQLAKASEIFVVDNAVFGSMFPVLRCPPDSSLEEFYEMIGSKRISGQVDCRVEKIGQKHDTLISALLRERIRARSPLLLSRRPGETKKALVSGASEVLTGKRTRFLEASELTAVYTLQGIVRRRATTCCSESIASVDGPAIEIVVVPHFDYFDVGKVIAELILEEPDGLEDALLIGTILESSVEKLRARGFAVDRIIGAEKPRAQSRPICATTERRMAVQPSPKKAVTETCKPHKNETHRQASETKTAAQPFPDKPARTSRKGFWKFRFPARKLRSDTPARGNSTTYETRRQVRINATSHKMLQQTLRDAVASTRPVSAKGVLAQPTKLISTPKGLDSGHSCEMLPGQSLEPLHGANNSVKGIRVFSSRSDCSAETFLKENLGALDAFSQILLQQCDIFGLQITNIAVFYDSTGTTLAFNCNRAIYFNLYYFVTRHYHDQATPAGEGDRRQSLQAVADYFVITAHELAHNLVRAHGEKHGRYTEELVSLYLPEFVSSVVNQNEDS